MELWGLSAQRRDAQESHERVFKQSSPERIFKSSSLERVFKSNDREWKSTLEDLKRSNLPIIKPAATLWDGS